MGGLERNVQLTFLVGKINLRGFPDIKFLEMSPKVNKPFHLKCSFMFSLISKSSKQEQDSIIRKF